jgi:uncharacterized membrane protein
MENNVIVLGFEGQTTALDMLTLFETLQEKEILVIEDAVIATRGVSDKVEIKQTQSVTGKFTLRGTGIGLLAGVLLGGPIGGVVAGATIGAIAGKMKDIGIDDKFIKETSRALGPNSSALFLMGHALDRDKFMEEIRPFKAVVASTTLSPEQEKELQAALKREE